MKLELLVTATCSACQRAREIWERASAAEHTPLHVVDVSQPEGTAIMTRLALKTVPAVLVDGVVKGVGVQGLDHARQIIRAGLASGPGRG